VNILVVDDDPAQQTLFSRFFRRHKFRVFTASDALQAIYILGTERVDLVLTDLRMPHLDGTKLLSRIRELPQHQETPVIVISGCADEDDVEQAMRQGASLFLEKPVVLDQLLHLARFAA
jgi:CheY-like chemotaxis protein